jgi:hypothetical protein
MANVRFAIALVLLVSLASAATCAEKSYTSSCRSCKFDSNGKMDSACYQSFQDRGVACLFAAYPMESIEYKAGSCPGIDICVDRLNTCKALYSSGNDFTDCSTGDIDNCFRQGDICVAEATKDCSKPPPEQPMFDAPPEGWCDGLFFGMAILFIGLIKVKMKG